VSVLGLGVTVRVMVRTVVRVRVRDAWCKKRLRTKKFVYEMSGSPL